VPGALLADGAAASLTDRGHSLRSLASATGGVPIAPQLLSYISISFNLQITMLLFVKGEDLYWRFYFLHVLCYDK